ncbi:uncharacterized transporter slc-17.2-like [Haliotis rufescens]|uniref:uncharacterized transporter slc-17.2-like n=1 Tax=Haliotis rufescens TaxID=6454 RepID=UPI00201F883C|nr:uncharacterized transporter slc-17.2-like [Haliotis rufescens]
MAEVNGTCSAPKQHHSDTLPENYPTVIQKYTSYRWRFGYMMILGMVSVQCMKNCMSFALVCMTRGVTLNKGEHSNQSNAGTNYTAAFSPGSSGSLNYSREASTAEFDYSSQMQGLLISSTYYIGIISPIFGSMASRRFGAKRVICACMMLGGVTTIAVPVAARSHVYLAVICRLLLGFAINGLLPVTLDVWLYWAPTQEKAQLVAYTFTGYNIASIVTFFICGFLCLTPIDNGWPFIFYVFGGCAILWGLAWMYWGHDKPEMHPRISQHEKIYILTNRTNVDIELKDKNVPWKDIFRSKPVWAYLIVIFLHTCNSSILASYLPLYMATVLNFDVEQNGVLSSLPYVTRVMGTVFWSHVSMKLVKKISVTHTRKLIQTIGFAVASVLTIGLCSLEDGQEIIAVAIFVVSMPFQSVTAVGCLLSPVDIAPQFASFLTALGEVFSFVAYSLAPVTVSYIVTERTREQWSTVFYISAGIYVVAALIFIIFGSGKIEPWADNSADENIPEPTRKSEINEAYVKDMDDLKSN